MKNTKYLILSMTMLMALLCSCNKEYTCTCTSDIDGSTINVSQYDLSKENAESACHNADTQVDVTCKLD